MAHVKFALSILILLVLSLSSRTPTIDATTKIDVQSSASSVIPKSSLGNEIVHMPGLLHKEGVPRKSRKLLEDLVQVDYDYAGPNPKHAPRKGRGGRSLLKDHKFYGFHPHN